MQGDINNKHPIMGMISFQLISVDFYFVCIVIGARSDHGLPMSVSNSLREDIDRKKNVFFLALPESPKPPPHDPNSGNLVLLFRTSKTTF